MDTKEDKGITLISLVITIIILIILSSVGIYLSLGNNGIFTRAKEAREVTNKQQATDIINLKITTAQMNKYAEEQRMPTLKELSEVLRDDNEIRYVTEKSQVASTTKYDVGENPSSIYTKLKKYPYEFEINSSLQLASINGVKVASQLPSTNSNYSTSEQVVGTWIDGKPLYRKVVVFENLTYDGKNFEGNLNIKDLNKICRAEVYHNYYANNINSIESARYDYSDYYFNWYIYGETVKIQNRISNIKNFDYIIIIEYTKNK